jgi:YidC/Oxa1 family membrane protein insertase
MLAFGPFQALLDGLGWVLAWIYDIVGNYGVAIIVLTLVIRLILFPLGIKQIKSMQAMQSIQPKVKELQKKYKGNKAKVQEETMKLYQEAGVSPFGGCLPLLLQFPILIAMYAVIRAPVPNAAFDPDKPVSATNEQVLNNHLPIDSQLYEDVISDEHMDFLWMNLQCSASQSGGVVVVPDSAGEPSGKTLDCGDSTADRVPYFVILILMIGTTFYQQRQMQKASPPGAASSQQQAILKFMPILFGVFGFAFPSGLVVYWTTSNLWQIGQQYALLRAGHIGPEAMERRMAEQRAKADSPEQAKQGYFARLMNQARETQAQQAKGASSKGSPRKRPPPPKGRTKGGAPGGKGGSGGGPKGGSVGSGGKGSGSKGTGGTPPKGGQTRSRRPNTGQQKGREPGDGSTGGGNGGDGAAGA